MKRCPFVIMNIKERKKPCLMVWTGVNELVKIASFNNEESAEIFAKTVNELIDDVYELGRKV